VRYGSYDGEYEDHQLPNVHIVTSQKAVIIFHSNIMILQLYIRNVKSSCKFAIPDVSASLLYFLKYASGTH